MKNYREQGEQPEVAYRNPEQNTHEDRRNRNTEWSQAGTQRYHGDVGAIEGFRGKGPRNYKRSDERIREIICDLLCNDPHLDASDMEVEVKNGNVILTGSVEDRFAKRLAEDLAESVLGVVIIENRIHVNQDNKHLQGQEHVRLNIV
jgi:osmotically-inducible protein OsmY